MRYERKIKTKHDILIPEIHELAYYKNRIEFGPIINFTDTRIEETSEGQISNPLTLVLSYDLDENRYYVIENNYYRLKDKVGEEDYYQFRDSDMEPVNLADINKESEEALRKEIKRLKAELADIHKKLKIKKGDK